MSGRRVILDGRVAAEGVRAELRERVRRLRERGCVPRLGIVLAGDFAPSHVYVRNKERGCREVGIEVEIARFGPESRMEELREQVERWNEDRSVHGVIVQLPVPKGLDGEELVERVRPEKDVDGLTSVNMGLLARGRPGMVPATAAGVVELLARNGIRISGRRVVVVGRGALVGRPLASLLLLRGERGDATVTVCHSGTRDLAEVCRSAEILVVAAGRVGLVTGEMVSDGVVVVDAGTNRTERGLVGDVDFESVASKASAITPVPGGVGPMTVAMLLSNVVRAAERGAA